jgi:hypothetical protein
VSPCGSKLHSSIEDYYLLDNQPTHKKALLRAKPITGSRKATITTISLFLNFNNLFIHIII